MFSLLKMNFTERLNQAFERAGITKTALWKHCGVSSGLVTQWLDGSVKKAKRYFLRANSKTPA